MDERAEPPAGPTGEAWRRLGVAEGLRLESARVLQVDLPFHRPVATALGVHRHRPLVLVQLVCRTDHGSSVEGWGECAALADTTYDAEDADSAFASLRDALLPALVVAAGRSGTLSSVDSLPAHVRRDGRPLAWSALEMAVGDAYLRAGGRSLAEVLGVTGAHVVPGAVLGLPTSTAALLADLGRLEDDGYARAKVKVAPGSERLLTDALGGRATGAMPVQVDANGAYGPATVDGLDVLDRLGLLCIEQPLDRDDLAGHRVLTARLATPICLDESVGSPHEVVAAVSTGACSVVCIKPARLGGISGCLDVVDWCRSAGVPWWFGGMFESGYGRHVLTALAALPGPTLPGDLAPPSAYLAADLVEPVPVTRDPTSGARLVAVHQGPGVAPAPSPGAIDALLVRRSEVAAGPG
jgi:O-succinylbenzoate synthase